MTYPASGPTLAIPEVSQGVDLTLGQGDVEVLDEVLDCNGLESDNVSGLIDLDQAGCDFVKTMLS